jgi:hypothetical protein
MLVESSNPVVKCGALGLKAGTKCGDRRDVHLVSGDSPPFAAQSRKAERGGHDREGEGKAPGVAENGEVEKKSFIARYRIEALFERWKKDSPNYVRQYKDSADEYSGQNGSSPIAHKLLD